MRIALTSEQEKKIKEQIEAHDRAIAWVKAGNNEYEKNYGLQVQEYFLERFKGVHNEEHREI